MPGSPLQISNAKRGMCNWPPVGGWTQIELDGDVKLKDGERSGQADHALASACGAIHDVDGSCGSA